MSAQRRRTCSRAAFAAGLLSVSRNERRGAAGCRSRMNYVLLTFAGVVIGFIVAAPIGPVNLICMRRTLKYGTLNGFISGLGAAAGDGVFATVVAFGLTAIRHWIEGYSMVLQIAGGALLLGFGVHTYLADPLHGPEIRCSSD